MEKAAVKNMSGDESEWNARASVYGEIGGVQDVCSEPKRHFEQSESDHEAVKKFKGIPQISLEGEVGAAQTIDQSDPPKLSTQTEKEEEKERTVVEKILTLNICPILGAEFQLQVSNLEFIFDIKDQIFERLEIPVEDQILVSSKGILANDDMAIFNSGLQNHSKVKLFVQMTTGNDMSFAERDDDCDQSLLLCFINPDEYILLKFPLEKPVELDETLSIASEPICKLTGIELETKHTPAVCMKCEKKLRITNTFKCKCNQIFCNMHRFNDQHDCSFDYKSAGKEELEKQNPLICNPKVQRL